MILLKTFSSVFLQNGSDIGERNVVNYSILVHQVYWPKARGFLVSTSFFFGTHSLVIFLKFDNSNKYFQEKLALLEII